MKRCFFSFAVLLLVAVAVQVPAQAEDALAKKLLPLVTAHEGKIALVVKNLKTGESFTHNADVPMPTASLIKLPIMVEAYRQADSGTVDLQKMITLQAEDKVPGSGILTTHFSAGMSLPVVDAIQLMMVYSDNTATNLVLNQIGLPATNETMEKLKLPNTKVHSLVFKGSTSIHPERSKLFGLGSTTAGEMVALLEQLDEGKLASESATKAMKKHLSMCEDKRLSKLLPPEVKVLQKTGSVSAVRTVAGIFEFPNGHVAICLLTSQNKDQRWKADNAGEVIAHNIGRVLFEHYQPKGLADASEADLVLKVGSQGARVEQVQQALNKQLSPSPDLNPDGEYGPITKAAVIAWQKMNKLPETGEIDRATWKKLGLAEEGYRPR